MPNNIQTIIDKFDEEFVKYLGDKVEPIFIDAVGSVGPIRKFLKDSLTSMLDGIILKLPKQKITMLPDDVGSLYETETDKIYNDLLKELINIINSHR